MRRTTLALLTVLALSCDGAARRPAPSNPGPRKPSCDLPICAACACDTTTACDDGCSACDAECGNCRAAEAECVTPRDAGPNAPGDAGPNGPQGDGGPGRTGDAAPVSVDAGPCAFPLSQGLSEPCCIQHGIDACGAGLFCAAFDGRTQATCYEEGTRREGQECGIDLHCTNGRCPQTTHVCGPAAGDACSVNGEPCAPAADGGTYFCDPSLRRCAPTPVVCDPDTHQPCSAGESCYQDIDEAGVVSAVCHTTGTAMSGDDCKMSSDCARQHLCLPFAGHRCILTCSAAHPCPTGSCTGVPVGAGQNLGVCPGA